MTDNAYEWSAARGDRWLAHYAAMEATLAPIDDPLLRALALDGPAHVAEVGSGGGGTALHTLQKAHPDTVVHGYDISPSLVDAARARVPDALRPRLTFSVADMQHATPPRAYDRLLSRFGVMFFADPDAAFANLARWLAPHGRFAFAVWGHPAQNAWISMARDVVASVVEVPTPPRDAPGPFRYADAVGFVERLARSGFADVAVDTWSGHLPVGGGLAPDDAARFALSSFSTFADLLTAAGERAYADAHRTLADRYRDHVREGVVQLPARVHLVTGRRGDAR